MTTIKRPEELDAYRVAVELRERVLAIVARPAVARDFKFCDQIRDSARSAPANLSEGLGRYKPRDNARFVRNALGSLNETQNHLGDAHSRKYIEEEEFYELFALAGRAIKTSTGWHNYLVNCPVKPTSESTQNPRRTFRTKNDQTDIPASAPGKPEQRKTQRRTGERRAVDRRKGDRRTNSEER
jgi:four helix bundle protein